MKSNEHGEVTAELAFQVPKVIILIFLVFKLKVFYFLLIFMQFISKTVTDQLVVAEQFWRTEFPPPQSAMGGRKTK